jgi:pimeloyl-ACP methyl ester carboxylesterase
MRLASLALYGVLLLSGGGVHAAPATTGTTARIGVNGLEIHYEIRGSGEPLLLLHGFGGCGRDWEPFVAALSEDFRLIIPDLRGHGRSSNPSGRFSHREVATDVLALLDRIAPGPIKAIGISTGGMSLLHVATRDPGRIEAMVLVGVAPHFPEQARAITRAAAANGPRPQDLDYFRGCAVQGEAQVEALARHFAGFATSVDDVNFSPGLLRTIRSRTLLVHGDRDEFFPVELPLQIYRAIPRAALWIVPQGPHVPIHGEHTTEFLSVSQRFLGEPAASR